MEHTCDAIHTRRTAHDAFEAALLHRAEDLKDNYCRIMQPTKSTHTRQKKKKTYVTVIRKINVLDSVQMM